MPEEKNQLIIDMGDIKLTDKELKSLHNAIHKAVTQKIKKAAVIAASPKVNKPAAAAKPPIAGAAEVQGKTASLKVDFNTVDAGLSNFTATHKGVAKTIHESDTITFDNVKVNDTIVIKGDSAGSKTVTISGVKATPIQMNFAEGQHVNGIFLVIA